MFPELFKIGPIAIRGYGLMLTISFLLGLYYIYKISQKTKANFDHLLNIAFIMIFGGVVGARLFYVFFHLDEFSGNWLDSFNPFHSGQFGIAGLNLYGGVVTAIILSFIYIRKKEMPLLATFDTFAPTLGLGLIFTRIGCFMNGCCFGTPTDLPWGVSFPLDSIPYYVFGDAHLHPAQLYSSFYGLFLFLFLHWRLKHKSFDGQVVALLFMIEAIFRYLIEFVRYYESEMHFSFMGMNPTYNQAISIMLFALGLAIYIIQFYSKQAKTAKIKG
jgi:phosphatidylglycerol---prolipoprotein diacylglyceryl transferase